MGRINFFTEAIEFKVPKPRKTSSWIQKIISRKGFSLAQINYIFCSDDYLAQINQEYLNHKTYTDIITFNHSDEKKRIEGDIYISIDRVRDNASKFQSTFEVELRRVIIHGVLHLLGYSDKSKAQKAIMRKKEDECLSLWR